MKYLWIICVVAALLGLITYAVAGGIDAQPTAEEVQMAESRIGMTGEVPAAWAAYTAAALLANARVYGCQAKMEVAMRAMDEFVGPEPTTVNLNYVPPAARLRAEAERLDRLDKAREQWAAVKNACWVQP